MEEEKLERAITTQQMYSMKRVVLDFTAEWLASFGKPEQTGSWLVWAKSGSGKTTFMMLLAKYLTSFGRVLYVSREEKTGLTIESALRTAKMEEVGSKFNIVLDDLDRLKKRLRKHKAQRFVFIDSLQYMDLTYAGYKKLIAEFPKVLFIIVSHNDKKEPKGQTANSIRHDANVKIFIEGYVAFPVSRQGGNRPFVIWKEGAEKYHGFEWFKLN